MKKILQLLTLTTLLATSLSAAPIHDAARDGNLAEVRRLLDGGASVDAQNNDGWTPLHLAAEKGRTEIVRLLIDRGASVDAQDNDGETPLHFAADNGRTEMAQLLIDRGASVDAQNNDGETPLHWAASNGHTEIVQLLIDRGARVDIQDNAGWTPLRFAARTPLYWVACNDRTEIAQLLKTILCLNKSLWSAAHNNHLATAKKALRKGAQPNAIAPAATMEPHSQTGDTPMHIAVENKNAEMVKLLLAFGGRIDIPNKSGTTAWDMIPDASSTILPLILEATVAEPQTEHGQALIQQLREQAEAAKAPQFRPVYSLRKDLEEFANSLNI